MVHAPSPDHAKAVDGSIPPGELRHSIEQLMSQQLWPIGLGVAAVYAISAGFQLAAGGWSSRPGDIIAAIMVVVFATLIALASRRGVIQSQYAHRCTCILGIAALAEAMWCIVISPNPNESLYIALVILGSGMLMLSPMVWATLTIAAAAVWIWAAAVIAPQLGWSEYQFVIIGSVMLSGVSMAMRLRVVERLETERLSRARHAQQLQVSEQRQSIILDALPLTMYTVEVVDGKMRTTWVSEQVERLTGYKARDFIDDPQLWNRNIHPDDQPLTLRQARAITAEGQAAEEFRWLCADGKYRWFLDHAVAIYDDAGRKCGLIGIWLDIDERKRVIWEKSQLESELRQSQKLEAVGTLASGIAHDFNNLLTAIHGFVTVARESLDRTHPTQEHLSRIEEAADRARQVTRSLLTFAHHAPSQKRPMRLAQLMNDSMPLLRRLLPRHIRIDIPHVDDTLWIHADATQMQRVLVNLAINAGDAMADRDGTMCMTLKREANDAVLMVEDNGPGMTEQVRERIFEPFFTTHPRGEGTGLGLPVVHGILTDHHATISVDSAPGCGTRFAIRIPTCRAPLPSMPDDQPPSNDNAPRDHTLLLADPDPYVRQIMAETLESHGYQVHAVDNGEQAARWLTTHNDAVALVIADAGADLSWLSEARAQRADLNVMLISESPDALPPNERSLPKPFQMSQLVQQVERVLAREPLTELELERSD